jgi:hypothetical protein
LTGDPVRRGFSGFIAIAAGTLDRPLEPDDDG